MPDPLDPGGTKSNDPQPLARRRVLKGALGVGAGLALAGPFGALADRAAAAPSGGSPRRGRPHHGGYGELVPVRDQTTGLPLLNLPRGFEYLTFGWTGDVMADGRPTPGGHDGMGAFRDTGPKGSNGSKGPKGGHGRGNLIHLVRNHELGTGTPFAAGGAVYDPTSGGGTTTLTFDTHAGHLVEHHASLSGTIRNCAGGITPAGTWLTCEETTQVNGDTRHGYVFEVPTSGLADARPLKQMGRFSHEATATDPRTGIVYETEDAGSSALYRYLPVDAADLAAGGVLQAMRLEGTDTTASWVTGTSARADWVAVDQPDWGPGERSCWEQAAAGGAARIVRGEGLWYGNDVVYVVSTSGGPVGEGQVFAYDPAAATFTCIYASPSADVLDAPDNITVSPRGGLVLCEDGGGREYLHGLTPDGEIFRFAENNAVLSPELAAAKGYGRTDYTGSEWAGATFEPQRGEWLFVNLQSPGITFAITGPWRRGAL